MTPKSLHDAVAMAESFIELAKFLERNYPKYCDGFGTEHYVYGPACTQMRHLAKDLQCELSFVRLSSACPLPRMAD